MIHVEDLAIGFPTKTGRIRTVVDRVSMTVESGKRVGLVGESGSGKSILALACLGLIPEPGRLLGGSVVVDGIDLAAASAADLQRIRGGRIGMVFQEATASLNPVYTVGFQLVETIRAHHGLNRTEGRIRAESLLREVALEDPASVSRAYPHELSGGQAQRVMIALALAGDPDVLIADEATSAIDRITQTEVLCLLEGLTRERGMGLLLISHDLTVVRTAVEKAFVMFAGEVVEEGPTPELFGRPLHPYTQMLLASVPGNRKEKTPQTAKVPSIPPAAASGCGFSPRCRLARPDCRENAPTLKNVTADRLVRCPVAVEKQQEGSHESS